MTIHSSKLLPERRIKLWDRVGKIFGIFILSIILLVILAVILIQTRPVQNYARTKIVSYLEKKLKTKVQIGQIDVNFPHSILLQNVYIEDQRKDTLLSGGEIRADIDMFRLLKNEVKIGEMEFNGITARVKRLSPDTVFNFQFIVDAFGSGHQKVSANADTTTMKMNIDRIFINNSHIFYSDAISGNEMDLVISHLDSRISTFDPGRLFFIIPELNSKGLRGYFSQDNIITRLNVGNLITHLDTLDLLKEKIDLKDATLSNSDIDVTMSNKQVPPVAVKQLPVNDSHSSFSINSGQLTVTESNFIFNNTSMPATAYGMDYGHLDMKDLNIQASNFSYNIDTIIAGFKSGSFKEKSGFVLNELRGDFLYTNNQIALTDMYIKTPGSSLRKNAVIRFPSLDELVKDPSVLNMDLDLESSSILIKDLLIIAPMLRQQVAFSNPSETWLLNGRIRGRLNDLQLTDVGIKGMTGTSILASGRISGLPDPKKFSADLIIAYFNTTQKDLKALLPPNTLPANVTLPQSLTATGKLKASMNDLVTDLTIKSSLGSATLIGNILNYSDTRKATYDMNVIASSLQLGTITGNQQMIGALSGNFMVKGNGFDPQTARADIKGTISSAFINNYNYRDVKVDATLANKTYTANASIFDPNIHLTIQADGAFNSKYPGLHFTADIDSIKTEPLHLTPQTMIYHGRIVGNLTNTNPDMLTGTFLITNSVLVNNGQRMMLDTVKIVADNTMGKELISIQSEFLLAEISGQYKLTQLADIFQQSLDPYFSLTSTKNTVPVNPYDFTINARLFSHPAIKAFLPGLQRLDSVNISANFSSVNGWNASVIAPMMITSNFKLGGFKFNAVTKNNQLQFSSSFSQFRYGSQLAVYATDITGTIANNQVNFAIGTKDPSGKEKYKLAALFTQPSSGNYSFQLSPEGLMLNYEAWTVNPNNSLVLLDGDIIAKNFVINNKGQQMSLNSLGAGANRPLSIVFSNFKIATLAAFIQSDSLLVNGSLSGNVLLKDYKTQPVFTADLNVIDLTVFRDTIGNVSAKVNNRIANEYNADIVISGKGNEVKANGIYYVKPDNNSSYDFSIDIGSLQLKSLQAFSLGGMRYSSGSLNGKIALKGTMDNPNVDGLIKFDHAGFNITALNSHFNVDGQTITIDNGGIAFNKLIIKDTTDNEMVLNGRINTADFHKYEFDLSVVANNFQALNTSRLDNKLFYGKMIITTSAQIRGTQDNPIIDGAITVKDATKFTVVLPQTEPGVVEREGIVKFVDMDAAPEDSLFLAVYDSLNVSPIKGFDITANIEVEQNAEFNLIVDEGNGDFIKIRGEALLTAGIDPSGKVTLVGSYELESGSYEFSFNFIKRKFDIQKGSRIVWDGEPTTADIDITAIYIADAAPYDLVQNQIAASASSIRNTYLQKLPFEVHLLMKGQLLEPILTFDIILPIEKNYGVAQDIINNVQSRLILLREEPSELNKQVFALLLLNRFVAENPFDNLGGSSFDAGIFARQSVSKLLTEQLNALAGGLIAGVDINFDLTTAADFTTGERLNRTDINVALSKRLLGERLTITVGSNFELEGPRRVNQQQNNLAGNVALDYKLSPDGRLLLRVYRKNEFEGTVEGYIVEQGISFIINVDYNYFREIFHRSKQKNNKKVIKTEQ